MLKMKLSTIFLVVMFLNNLRIHLIIEENVVIGQIKDEDIADEVKFRPDSFKNTKRNYTLHLQFFELNCILMNIFQ